MSVPPYCGVFAVGVDVVVDVGVVVGVAVGVVVIIGLDVGVVVGVVVEVLVPQDASTMADTTKKLKPNQINLFFTFSLLSVVFLLFLYNTLPPIEFRFAKCSVS